MSDGDRLRKLIDKFNRELCWAGCGVKCETREERERLENKVKDEYAQAIAAMFDERIAALEVLVRDMRRDMHGCWYCHNCGSCDRDECMFEERMRELGVTL